MENNMNITTAQYIFNGGENTAIKAIIDGQELLVSLDSSNRHYAEILKQVEAGTLTIADAE